MENNKETLINGGKMSCFYCHQRFLSTNRKYINDLFVGKVERDVASPILSGEELYNIVSEYEGIVFGYQSGK